MHARCHYVVDSWDFLDRKGQPNAVQVQVRVLRDLYPTEGMFCGCEQTMDSRFGSTTEVKFATSGLLEWKQQRNKERGETNREHCSR